MSSPKLHSDPIYEIEVFLKQKPTTVNIWSLIKFVRDFHSLKDICLQHLNSTKHYQMERHVESFDDIIQDQ